MTSDEIKQAVWNFLRSKGLGELSTAAVMGNIYQESRFDPNLVEYGSGVGFGLCQWSYSRRTQLEAYGTDLTHQELFLWSELTGQDTNTTGASYQWIEKDGYLTHTQFMNSDGDINTLTAAFCFCWERPAADQAMLSTRQQQAALYYSTYKSTEPPPPPPPPPVGTGDYKLKNNYLYPYIGIFLSRKFTSKNKKFTLVKTYGDIAVIKDGETTRKVPKKNLIKI